MNNRPIGIFDSGVGGLTVVDKVSKLLPNEDVIYFGDTARVPYGNKSKATVTRFSRDIIRLLLKFRVKLIIIACNTASSLSANTLKRETRVPVVEVIVPGVKEALLATRNKRIGVIGTSATISSGVYKKHIKALDKKAFVAQGACPLFVPLVENKYLSGEITLKIAKKYLSPLLKARIDTLILGCTHYPLLKAAIKKIAGRDVRLIDSSSSVARCSGELLKKRQISAPAGRRGSIRFFVSDDGENFEKMARIFLKKKITAKKVVV